MRRRLAALIVAATLAPTLAACDVHKAAQEAREPLACHDGTARAALADSGADMATFDAARCPSLH